MSKSNLTIDDLAGEPGESVTIKDDGSVERSSEPQDRGKEPQGTIAGFPTVSPFNLGDSTGATPGPTSAGISGINPDGSPAPRRRGRPPGVPNRPKDPNALTTSRVAENLIGLESLLLSVHMMGARMMDIPELEIDEAESKRYAEAVKEVAKHYNLAIDPKHMAIWQLGTCMASIYMPRFQQYNKRKANKPKLVSIDRQQTSSQPQPQPAQNRAEAPVQVATGAVQVAPSALWPVPPGEVSES
jgi:hypothetical protein